MADLTHNDDAIRALLSSQPRIALVGASDNPDRDSNRVFRYMVAAGYDVVPVNPVLTSVAGVAAVPDLTTAAAAGPIDIVDVFRSPEKIGPIVDEAIAVGAKSIWLQFGVVNPPEQQKALDAGLNLVVDRCIKVEHARLQPSS